MSYRGITVRDVIRGSERFFVICSGGKCSEHPYSTREEWWEIYRADNPNNPFINNKYDPWETYREEE